MLLKILCDYDARVGTLEVIEADRPIMVGDTPVRGTAPLKDGDTIRIDVGQFLRCNFSERIIEEERNIISQPRSASISTIASATRTSRSTASRSRSIAARWSA